MQRGSWEARVVVAATLVLQVGNEKNRMRELPESYSDGDLSVTDTNGIELRAGQRARLTGTMSIHPDANICSFNLETIERL